MKDCIYMTLEWRSPLKKAPQSKLYRTWEIYSTMPMFYRFCCLVKNTVKMLTDYLKSGENIFNVCNWYGLILE